VNTVFYKPLGNFTKFTILVYMYLATNTNGLYFEVKGQRSRSWLDHIWSRRAEAYVLTGSVEFCQVHFNKWKCGRCWCFTFTYL